ncbi:MAG TPA: hypothetical protein VLD65_09525 [Anaerolineales bacterium]|nr:hypothetical protein [Anaerolineales bacterium]
MRKCTFSKAHLFKDTKQTLENFNSAARRTLPRLLGAAVARDRVHAGLGDMTG